MVNVIGIGNRNRTPIALSLLLIVLRGYFFFADAWVSLLERMVVLVVSAKPQRVATAGAGSVGTNTVTHLRSILTVISAIAVGIFSTPLTHVFRDAGAVLLLATSGRSAGLLAVAFNPSPLSFLVSFKTQSTAFAVVLKNRLWVRQIPIAGTQLATWLAIAVKPIRLLFVEVEEFGSCGVNAVALRAAFLRSFHNAISLFACLA